eukprot:1597049-Rhodomonas_salina.4
MLIVVEIVQGGGVPSERGERETQKGKSRDRDPDIEIWIQIQIQRESKRVKGTARPREIRGRGGKPGCS